MEPPLVVNGWTLFAHPLFLDQIESLAAQVERLKARDPAGYRGKNATKRLDEELYLEMTSAEHRPTRPKPAAPPPRTKSSTRRSLDSPTCFARAGALRPTSRSGRDRNARDPAIRGGRSASR